MFFKKSLKDDALKINSGLIFLEILVNFPSWHKELCSIFPAMKSIEENAAKSIYLVASIFIFTDTFKEDVDINRKDRNLIFNDFYQLGELEFPNFRQKLSDCETKVILSNKLTGGYFSSIENRDVIIKSLGFWMFNEFCSLNPTFESEKELKIDKLGFITIKRVLEYWKENCEKIVEMYITACNFKLKF